MLRLNARYLHDVPYNTVADWLRAHDMAVTTEFWNKIKANVSHLSDVNTWHDLVERKVTPVISDEDKDYCARAADCLPEGELDETSWGIFTSNVKEVTGRKGKQLFMPLRLALTARTDGPELPVLFALLGREKVEKRLRGEVV